MIKKKSDATMLTKLDIKVYFGKTETSQKWGLNLQNVSAFWMQTYLYIAKKSNSPNYTLTHSYTPPPHTHTHAHTHTLSK